MLKFILAILKRTYKILLVFLVAVIFFLGYNAYLVDHSLVNLRIALDKVIDAKTLEEAKKLEALLKRPLFEEISKREMDAPTLAELEFTKDTLADPKDLDQLEDVKAFLFEMISEKEASRGPIISRLDRLSSIIDPRTREISPVRVRAEARNLTKRIASLEAPDELQEVWFDLANLHILLEEFEASQVAFSKVVELDPDNPIAIRAKFNLGWVYKVQGKLDESISEFERLVQAHPESELVLSSRYQMAGIFKRKGEFEEAIERYKSLVEEYPEERISNLAQFQAGYTYLYDLKNPEVALELFSKLKGQIPESHLGEHMEKEMMPSIAEDYRNLGYRLLLKDRYLEAIKNFSLALKANPLDGASYAGEGLAYLWLDQPGKALEAARKSEKVASMDEVPGINLGFIYIQLGMLTEARELYRRLTSLYPDSPTAHYNLGYVYVIEGKLDDAAREFSKVLHLKPDFAFAYNNLGYTLWLMKRYQKAARNLARAAQLKPDYVDAHFNLGVVLAIQARYEESKKEFERVLGLEPEHPEAARYLRELTVILGE